MYVEDTVHSIWFHNKLAKLNSQSISYTISLRHAPHQTKAQNLLSSFFHDQHSIAQKVSIKMHDETKKCGALSEMKM